MTKVAFVGLGVMGFPMAGHLARSEYDVSVFNRTVERAASWTSSYVGQAAPTPREAAEGADLVFLCVGNDDDVRSVVFGEDGALAGMKARSVLVDHTTASAGLARELESACGGIDAGFLDAPISGGQVGAENGALTIMVGGARQAFEVAEPVMQTYAKAVKLMGPAGHGQLTKMVNQICIAGLVEALSEGLLFAEKVGLDPIAVVDVISKGAAQSWQMENRTKTMSAREFEHGFAVDWMRKDLKMCLKEAERVGTPLPVTSLVDQFYEEVQEMGGGRFDTSSLIARLANLSR